MKAGLKIPQLCNGKSSNEKKERYEIHPNFWRIFYSVQIKDSRGFESFEQSQRQVLNDIKDD